MNGTDKDEKNPKKFNGNINNDNSDDDGST